MEAADGFLYYVFNIETINKNALLNMLQYTVLSILPLLLLFKGIQYGVPEVNKTKGSVIVLAESVAHLLFIMLALWFINRIICYIPTYSGKFYNDFNEITCILPFVLLLLTLHSKLGSKFQLLIDRLMTYWYGREGYAGQSATQAQAQQQQQASGGMVRVTQPLSPIPSHYPSQADMLPSDRQYSQMPTTAAKQQSPDFNAMYKHNPTPLVDAVSPGPVAANELGGSSWGSAF